MINIAICDDSEFDARQIKDRLDKYSANKQINFSISSFSNPKQLLYELLDNYIADIYILDVSMPELDGFELADEIRKYSESAVIIFLTSNDDMVSKGYKSKALRYIIKLNLERDIEEAIDSAISEVSKNDGKTVTIRRYNDLWRLPYGEIISVTRVSRQLLITTNSRGELTDNRGIGEFFKVLDDKRFLFIDRSTFVNIDYISQIVGGNLKLKNGNLLPVSRRLMQAVRETLLEQWGL